MTKKRKKFGKVITVVIAVVFAVLMIATSIISSFHSNIKLNASVIGDVVKNAAIKTGIKLNNYDKTEGKYSSSAKGMATINAETGELIFSKNMNEKLPMASTTKVFTAITVIENTKNLDEMVTVSPKAVGVEGTSLYLEANEKLSVKNLLYGLMLRSGNDAAVALAIHTSGNVEKFCELMNKTAKKVGALNSNFKNPHGLDVDEHYTTAYDLALMTAYALKNPEFKEIVSTKKVTMPWQSRGYDRVVLNKNRLLNTLEGCIGVKTGYTKKAGRCFVGATSRDGFTYVSVVLNCGPMFEEAAEMLNLCHQHYNKLPLLPVSAKINETGAKAENGEIKQVSGGRRNSIAKKSR